MNKIAQLRDALRRETARVASEAGVDGLLTRRGQLERRLRLPRPGAAVDASRPTRHPQRQKVTRRLARLNDRLEETVKHAHYDACRFLLTNYDVVLCPTLAGNFMHGATQSRAMALSSYKFCQRLGSRAVRWTEADPTGAFRKKMVWRIRENGTSRTCGTGRHRSINGTTASRGRHCGAWKPDLGASPEYHCTACGVHTGRDTAAARNHILSAWTALAGRIPDPPDPWPSKAGPPRCAF